METDRKYAENIKSNEDNEKRVSLTKKFKMEKMIYSNF